MKYDDGYWFNNDISLIKSIYFVIKDLNISCLISGIKFVYFGIVSNKNTHAGKLSAWGKIEIMRTIHMQKYTIYGSIRKYNCV